VVDDAAEAPIRPLTSLQGLPYALFLQVDSAVCSPRALCERAGPLQITDKLLLGGADSSPIPF
jgi:hypothetical protein